MVRVAVLGVVAVLVLGGLFVALRPDPPAAGPEERTVEVELQADGMSPAEITVGESDRVTLSFTADRPRGFPARLRSPSGGRAGRDGHALFQSDAHRTIRGRGP